MLETVWTSPERCSSRGLEISRPTGAGEYQGPCKPITHNTVAVARNTLKLGLCRQSPRKAMVSTEPDFLVSLCHGFA